MKGEFYAVMASHSDSGSQSIMWIGQDLRFARLIAVNLHKELPSDLCAVRIDIWQDGKITRSIPITD